MSFLSISNINKSYFKKTNGKTETTHVLKNINLDIEKGEFVTFFGPNACGKTTLLRVIANLEPPDSGFVKLQGRRTNKFSIGFIFQNFSESLYPWRSNLNNIVFPLQLEGIKKKERLKIAKQFIQKLGLNVELRSYHYQLSEGQKQLVAIARGLIHDPDFLLMDEPFSSLDYQTRFEMHLKIMQIWERTKKTILFVSHEIDEAIFLADKIVVLSKRPATILDVIHTKLPRPRNHALITSIQFVEIKNRILDIFLKQI